MKKELTTTNGSGGPPLARRSRLLMQEFGHLWTRIEHDLPITQNQARKVGFCAKNPGEGTTSVALNYASILGQGGKRVTLIEANFRHPGMSKALGVRPAPGLWELLEGTAELAEATHTQVVEGLNLITAGDAPGKAVLQRANLDLEPVLAQLDPHNDIIVLDVPPLSSSPEANLILPQLDGVVLVVQANRNRLCAVERAVKELEHLQVPILGSVLNKMRYDLPHILDQLL